MTPFDLVVTRQGARFMGRWFPCSVGRGGIVSAKAKREGDGGIGTLFANEGYEARLELRQRRVGGWQGVVGVQTFFRDFLAVGAEAFVPPNETFQTGLFTLQEFDTGALQRNLAFGRKYKITGTPTLIFANNVRVPGAISAAEVEKHLAAH